MDLPRLFDSEDILQLEIFAEISKIRKDNNDNRSYHPAKISYKNSTGKKIICDVKIRTRGIFRRNPRNCNFPPLMLKFRKADVKNTIFDGKNFTHESITK